MLRGGRADPLDQRMGIAIDRGTLIHRPCGNKPDGWFMFCSIVPFRIKHVTIVSFGIKSTPCKDAQVFFVSDEGKQMKLRRDLADGPFDHHFALAPLC